MGPLFQTISRIAPDAGTTPLLAHHSKKGIGRGLGRCEPLDLDDLAYAGVGEFARQWILLSRRKEYELGTGFP